ncbi:MAG: 2-oxo acid dehydrogenase subunit E2 [Candidatus Nanohaloarchaea archaeon]
MSLEFKFPDTGEGVTEGQFLEWTVEEGDEIEEDQTVAEVETDKAVVDIPAPTNGTVKELRASPGDKVKVGDVIMVIDDGSDTGETSEESEVQEEPEREENDTRSEDTEEDGSDIEHQKSSSGDNSEVLALPKVRKLAREKNVDLSKLGGGRITEADVREVAGEESTKVEEDTHTEEPETGEEKEENSRIVDTSGVDATPSVRKLAREKGVDIQEMSGSGRGGKITREDVLNANSDSTESTHSVSENKGGEERVEMTGIQRKIADRMSKSRFTAPHVTHMERADVTELVELRNNKKEEVDVHLTYLPFIMKAVQLAMKSHPELNAELDEEKDEIVLKRHYDFNIAVDTDRGLMVPLIGDVDKKNIVELAEEVGDKAGAAKHGELSASDMENGTFSITNLGVIGGEGFTPIINYPQTAILGIGKIQKTAEVIEGEVVPRDTVKLSLSYDHRVIDGATAARFMNDVIENLEDPDGMLLEL